MPEQEPIVVTLKHPVSYEDDFERNAVEVTELRLPRRVKARHLRAMDEATGEMGQALALIGAVTGLPKGAIDELDAEDVASAVEALAAPLAGLRATGPTSSG